MDSAESLQPLKLIEYPPNAFLPFAMTPPYLVMVSRPGPFPGGIPTTWPSVGKEKTPCLGALRRRKRSRGGVSARGDRRHDVAREPPELLLELLGRETLRPVDHEVLEPRVLRGDRLDALDHVRRRAAEPRLLLDAVGERRRARGRARRAPRAPLLVGVAHEAERREPLVTLVVRGLDAPLGLLGRVGQVEPGAPDHVLAELLLPAVLRARVAVRLHDVVEDLLAVERHHGLEVLAGHVVDRLATGDRHPDLDREMLGSRHARDVAKLIAPVLDGRRALVALAVVAEGLVV